VADPAHILVFCEDPGIGESLRAHLASERFNVTGAKTPLEAAWCLADGHVDLFLIHLPNAEWVTSAIVMEVRAAHPTLPIIGLAPAISNELGQQLARLHLFKVLPASRSWQGIAQTIHEALGSLESATGGRAYMASTKLAEPEPAQPYPDRQPASTVAPTSTPPSPVDSRTKGERPMRVVLLYQQDHASAMGCVTSSSAEASRCVPPACSTTSPGG
jgi:hypothetical protein